MEVAEACRVLGVRAGASADEVRSAFRQLLHRHHPDRAGRVGTETTTKLIAAYRVLRGGAPVPPAQLPEPAPEPAPPAPAPPPIPVWTEGDTVVVALPAYETYRRLIDASHHLGEVAYIDPSAPLLEVIVEFIDYPVCSVVMTLQGRSNSTTEAFVTVEALGGDPAPPADAVAALIAERIRNSGHTG